MGFVRWVQLLAMLGGCACGGSSAQVEVQKDWYPADAKSLVPGWTHGIEGKPFVGTAVWTSTGRDRTYGDGYMRTESVEVMRDGKGRERLAWRVVDADARVSIDGALRTVLVLDPVARCAFLWIEDGSGKSVDVVKVRCEPEGVDVPARPAWDALTEYEKAELGKEPESKPRYEDVAGETKDLGGVEAKSYKHEEVREFDAGKRVERTVDEVRWYADALGMVVATGGGERRPFFRDSSTTFKMEGVKLGEPPAGAFGWPAGAAVEVDAKLRLVWEIGARGQHETLRALKAVSDGEWPSVRTTAMTDQAGRMVHPAFPEAWFAGGPTVAMPTFYQGAKGKPFDASGQFNVYSPDDTSTVADQTIFFDVSRDGEGRARIKFRFLNGGEIEPVYVVDPVSGCIFQWSMVEPWTFDKTIQAEKKAKVRCQAHGVVIPPWPRWDSPNDAEKAQIAKAGEGKLHFLREKVEDEKMGGRDWMHGGESSGGDEIDAVKYAEYAVYAASEGKPERKVLVGEQWFAAEIDQVVKATVMPPAKLKGVKKGEETPTPRVVMSMNFFELGEPMEEFYPPRGYAIDVDETILPPFAPVAKVVAETSKPR